MQWTIVIVENGNMGFNDACQTYGVSKSTIKRHIKWHKVLKKANKEKPNFYKQSEFGKEDKIKSSHKKTQAQKFGFPKRVKRKEEGTLD